MSLQYTTSNTYQPTFSNRFAAGLHNLGNAMVAPTHWGFNQLLRSMDPFRRGRAKDLDQFPLVIEILSRPVRFALGLATFFAFSPLAMLGQGIKVMTSAAAKQSFTAYKYENKPSLFSRLFKREKQGALLDESNQAQTLDDVPQSLSELKIRTWNLAAMHSTLRAMNRTRPVGQRMNEVVEYVKKDSNDPDVLCFQEVFTEKATKILVRGLREKYPYVIHSVGKNTVGLNAGLMIFSKYPIEAAKFKPFTQRYGQNKLSQKGVLGAVLNLPGNEKAVVTNVHMEAGGSAGKKYFFFGKTPKNTKELQMKEALTLRDELEKEHGVNNKPIWSVFTGDTNSFLNPANETAVTKPILTQYARTDASSYESSLLRKRVLRLKDKESSDTNNRKTHKTKKDGTRVNISRVDYNEIRQNDENGAPAPSRYVETASVATVVSNTQDMSDHFSVLTTARRKMR